MKREIKFRAWDGNRMYYHDDSMKYGNYTLCFNDISGWGFVLEPCCVPGRTWAVGESSSAKINELMQFTGALDKNNKEIYEGDIVKWNKRVFDFDALDVRDEIKTKDFISFIEYVGHGFWVHDESFGWEGEDLWNWEEMEVIGNIYENPELLKQ